MSELYFIGGMFVLILIICTGAVIFFVKTYRQEMRDKMAAKAQKQAEAAKAKAKE